MNSSFLANHHHQLQDTSTLSPSRVAAPLSKTQHEGSMLPQITKKNLMSLTGNNANHPFKQGSISPEFRLMGLQHETLK